MCTRGRGEEKEESGNQYANERGEREAATTTNKPIIIYVVCILQQQKEKPKKVLEKSPHSPNGSCAKICSNYV